MTYRYYLQDMTFAVVLEVPTEQADVFAKALCCPVWDVYLGRKNCVPTELVYQGKYADTEHALKFADELASVKNRARSFFVRQGAHEGDVITLNDVPLQFGQDKRYRDRQVTVFYYGEVATL